ncbi:hypothetical protein AeMF1_014790 [Aphanomyces euteiches]|nr:hypothetical protein AeMF1_014790 [Aphanomyces euteiches]KAH9184699.1 hypothetical protein AeNC1_013325 [Aphanomyces euteiches]
MLPIYANEAQRDLLALIMKLDLMNEMTQELTQLKFQVPEVYDVADFTTNMSKMDVQPAELEKKSDSFSIDDGDDIAYLEDNLEDEL